MLCYPTLRSQMEQKEGKRGVRGLQVILSPLSPHGLLAWKLACRHFLCWSLRHLSPMSEGGTVVGGRASSDQPSRFARDTLGFLLTVLHPGNPSVPCKTGHLVILLTNLESSHGKIRYSRIHENLLFFHNFKMFRLHVHKY